MQLGVRVAQSIGVWQDFVTKLVDEVDQKAAEHVAALEAAAAQRHRELTDAVAAVGACGSRQPPGRFPATRAMMAQARLCRYCR